MTRIPYPVERLLKTARLQPRKTWLVQPLGDSTRTWTWQAAAREAGRMATALKATGWPAGSRIALAGRNCAHWFLADLAIQWAGYVSVPLYPRQSADSVRYVLSHAQCRGIFLGPVSEDDPLVAALSEGISDALLRIRLPYFDAPAGDTDWDALAQPCSPQKIYDTPAPDTLMTIIYTSGTQGHPKGAEMSFGALAWVTQSLLQQIPRGGDDERFLSFLPLAHVFERIAVEMTSLMWRAEVHFLNSSDQFAEQLARVAPTRFAAVPLVWSRFRAQILKQMPQAKLDRLLAVPGLRQLVQRRIRTRLGLHQVRFAVSGAAHLPIDTQLWFEKTLGLTIFTGYGLSESGGYAAANLPQSHRAGTVGKPLPDSGLRIGADEEIQLRHPGLMKRYHQEPELTAAAFTADGWFRTGDTGSLDADGFLTVVGRLKDQFKTAKGKYVAPAPIEAALLHDPHLEFVCVTGSQLAQPVAVVALTSAAAQLPREDLTRSLAQTLQKVNEKLEPHEKIARLLVTTDNWLQQPGWITPTLKVRRQALEPLVTQALADEPSRRQAVIWL